MTLKTLHLYVTNTCSAYRGGGGRWRTMTAATTRSRGAQRRPDPFASSPPPTSHCLSHICLQSTANRPRPWPAHYSTSSPASHRPRYVMFVYAVWRCDSPRARSWVLNHSRWYFVSAYVFICGCLLCWGATELLYCPSGGKACSANTQRGL